MNLRRCFSISDLEHAATRRLPAPVRDYLVGGADDEWTIGRNRTAFSQVALAPHCLTDVSTIDTRSFAFQQPIAWPFIVGPAGLPGMFHPDAEHALALATAQSGTLFCLSTMSGCSIESLAPIGGDKVFQLYVFKDRGLTRALIERAKESGYVALMLTVDVQTASNRERDKRSGFTVPLRLNASTLLAMAAHPAWCVSMAARPRPALGNFSGARGKPGQSLMAFVAEQFDPAVTWADLDWVARIWDGPLAVKGILDASDAKRAVAAGAATIVLSNHGGRQLDTTPSPFDVLERTVDVLAGSGEVILDGGVRRGTDILKAVAMGAKACMSARVGLFGLAAAGGAGVRHALSLLRGEVERDMALLGISALAALDRSRIVRLHQPSKS